MIRAAMIFALSLSATPVLADGDVAAGEELVAKRCKTCHMIADGDNVILKGGKTGPNLYAIIGRTAGTYEGFKYGDGLIAAGAKGLVWDAEQISAYIENPKGYLAAYLDDSKAKSKMAFKLKDADDRANVAAYLASLPQ